MLDSTCPTFMICYPEPLVAQIDSNNNRICPPPYFIKEALVKIERALRMNPFPPMEYLLDIALAHTFLRDYDEAVSAFKKVLSIDPKNQYARLTLIVLFVEMGRLEEARAEAKELLMIDPKWNSKEFLRRAPWQDPQYYERWTEAFKKVGL
jgi:tetratricopeptide (TPR) repeat protein